MTVLVLARPVDPHVDRVVEVLIDRGVPVFRTDLSEFPRALTIESRIGRTGWNGVLRNEHREVRFSEVRSVWYRHPSHFVLPDGLSGPERRHAHAEGRCGLGGTLSRLDALWVNYPSREADATKPAQLDLGRRCGLRVPESLVTNDPDAVRRFAAEIGGPIAIKNLSAAAIAEAGTVKVVYTRRLDPADLDDLRGVETTTHLFQEFIEPKAFEARVTVVGDAIFGAAIHAGTPASRIDFRSDYAGLRYAPVDPPPPVVSGIRAFMAGSGLVFGAFDFAVTENGEWVMFECNPFGAYCWLEDELGLPISAALADLLAAEVDR